MLDSRGGSVGYGNWGRVWEDGFVGEGLRESLNEVLKLCRFTVRDEGPLSHTYGVCTLSLSRLQLISNRLHLILNRQHLLADGLHIYLDGDLSCCVLLYFFCIRGLLSNYYPEQEYTW